jgi:hypothetical protein
MNPRRQRWAVPLSLLSLLWCNPHPGKIGDWQQRSDMASPMHGSWDDLVP